MNESPPQGKRSRRTWCCCGCATLLVLMIVVGGLSFWLGPPVLREMGVMAPPAEELFSGSMDPIATETVNAILDDTGVEGVEAVILPISGGKGQLVLFTIETGAAAAGIRTKDEAEVFFNNTLRQLVETNRTNNFNIEHVAVDYLDESGENLLVLTTPQAAVEAYVDGSINRREFLNRVEIDYSNLISAGELRELIEEGS